MCEASPEPDTKKIIKLMKIEGEDTTACFFRRLIKSVGVGVGGIVSDYCTFKNDLEELFFKLQKFLNHYHCLFVENRHSETPNQRHPLP